MRVAWISPLPPTQSGVADYSAELLEALAPHYSIDCFIADDHAYPALGFMTKPLPPSVALYGQHEFYSRAVDGYYDKIIFQWGSSNYHLYQWVVLYQLMSLDYDYHKVLHVVHDYPLSHLFVSTINAAGLLPLLAVASNTISSSKYDALIRAYGTLHTDNNASDKFMAALDGLGEYEIAEIGIIVVHRHDTKAAVEAKHHGAEVEVVRQSARIIKFDDNPRQRLGIPDERVIIATFGHIHRMKRNDMFIHIAQRILDESGKDGEIWLIGPFSDKQHAHDVQALAARDSRVKLFGDVSELEWHERMQACDLVIQLRDVNMGATSRAAVQAIRHGKPVLMSKALIDLKEPDSNDHPLFADLLHTAADFIAAGVAVLDGKLNLDRLSHLQQLYSFGEMVKRYRDLIEG